MYSFFAKTPGNVDFAGVVENASLRPKTVFWVVLWVFFGSQKRAQSKVFREKNESQFLWEFAPRPEFGTFLAPKS